MISMRLERPGLSGIDAEISPVPRHLRSHQEKVAPRPAFGSRRALAREGDGPVRCRGCHINSKYWLVLVKEKSRAEGDQRLGLCKN